MKLTANLILNVVLRGMSAKNIFSSRLPKTALNSNFFSFYLTEKISDLHLALEDFYDKSCVKEMCKKSIEKIMWNFAYMQKRIISAFVKAMQINFLPSAAS